MAEKGFALVQRAGIEIGPKIGSLAFHVLVVLIDHSNEDGECWPSRELIAEKTGMSIRSVGNQLRTLAEHSVISIRNRSGGATPRSNLYQILGPYNSNRHEVPIQTGTKCTPNRHETTFKQAPRAQEQEPRIKTKNKKSTLSVLDEKWKLLSEKFCGCVHLDRVPRLTDKRQTVFTARIKDPTWWDEAINALDRFDVLVTCFTEPGGWKPNLDWFMRPDTVTAIIEGKYTWKKESGTKPKPKRYKGCTYDPSATG